MKREINITITSVESSYRLIMELIIMLSVELMEKKALEILKKNGIAVETKDSI